MFSKGFTLIEILAAVMLLGLAIATIVASNIAYTQATAQAVQLSTAEFLVEQIRELTVQLPMRDPNSGTAVFGPEEAGVALYDDVDDFDGASFKPPIDCQRKPLTDFSDYRQAVTVENVSDSNFLQTVPDYPSRDFVRVTVRILYKNSEITRMSWIRSNN
ncbi:MAG: type II secretion system protein [Sedimentisphaerales bacterium]